MVRKFATRKLYSEAAVLGAAHRMGSFKPPTPPVTFCQSLSVGLLRKLISVLGYDQSLSNYFLGLRILGTFMR
jgi:hypothetical protein